MMGGSTGLDHGVGPLTPSERSPPPSAPAARAAQDRALYCLLAHAVPQYVDAVAWDSGRGHARDRPGRGALGGSLLATAVPTCGARLRFLRGAFISTGSEPRGTGEGR